MLHKHQNDESEVLLRGTLCLLDVKRRRTLTRGLTSGIHACVVFEPCAAVDLEGGIQYLHCTCEQVMRVPRMPSVRESPDVQRTRQLED